MRLSTYKSKPKRIYILVLLLLERWAQSEEIERSKNHKQNTPHFFSRSSFGYMKGGMEWIGFWNQIGSALDANWANSVGDDVNSEDEAKNIFKWKIIMEKKKKTNSGKGQIVYLFEDDRSPFVFVIGNGLSGWLLGRTGKWVLCIFDSYSSATRLKGQTDVLHTCTQNFRLWLNLLGGCRSSWELLLLNCFDSFRWNGIAPQTNNQTWN